MVAIGAPDDRFPIGGTDMATSAHELRGGQWVLAQSRPLRLATIFVLYIGQGVPIGLFWFAIPAWMAANGADELDIAYVLGLTTLPWTLKFLNGFIMDRYSFLSMGRRRPWIIGAQIVMIALFIVAALVDPGVEDVLLLGLAGFAVNLATTFQDVAVDGLAVDIMNEDEQAQAGGMMFGGQTIGMALATTLTGIAIARMGPMAAYLLSASFIGLITILLLFLREREGEKALPWSAGAAHPDNLEIHLGAWWPILRNTLKSLLKPLSLLWVPVSIATGLHYGVFTGVTPLIGTGEVGWNEEQVTSLVGGAQLVAGIAGLTIGGWGGSWLGAKKSIVLGFLAYLLLTGWMWTNVTSWGAVQTFTIFVYGWVILDTLLRVVTIPISMRLCDPSVAATQFAIYMAISNFGVTIGAWVLGLSALMGGLPSTFLVVFGVHLVAVMMMLVVGFPRSEKMRAKLAERAGVLK